MALKLIKHDEYTSWDLELREYLDGHCAASLEASTYEYYRHGLVIMARWAQAQGVSASAFQARHMRQFLIWRKEECGVCENTRRKDLFRAKVFFKWCKAEGLIERNPLADYKIPREEDVYVPAPSLDEVRQLLASVKTRFNPNVNPHARFMPPARRKFLAARNYAYLSVLIETGCRPGEACQLLLSDFQPDKCHLVFRKTKGDRFRVVPVGASIQAIKDWLKVRPKKLSQMGVDYLFVTEYGEAMQTRGAADLLEDQIKYAGLNSKYTQRSMRHYAITMISKTNLESARIIAGHRSIATTQRYLNMSIDDVRADHEAASPLGKALMVNVRTEQQKKRKRLTEM